MIQLNDCRIARRGKGAKGSVECQTIGKPVNDDNGIAKTFDYTDIHSVDTNELMEFAGNVGSINYIIGLGIDAILKRASIKSQNEIGMLQARIVSEGLAEKGKEAKALASSFSIAMKAGFTFDEIAERRKARMKK